MINGVILSSMESDKVPQHLKAFPYDCMHQV